MAVKVKTDTEKAKSSSKGSKVVHLREFKYHDRNTSKLIKGDKRDQAFTAASSVDTSTIHFTEPWLVLKESVSQQKEPPVLINGMQLKDWKKSKQLLRSCEETAPAANDPDVRKSSKSKPVSSGYIPILPQDLNFRYRMWLQAYSFTCQRKLEWDAPYVLLSNKEEHIARLERMKSREDHLTEFPHAFKKHSWRPREEAQRSVLTGWTGGRPPTVNQLLEQAYRKGYRFCPRDNPEWREKLKDKVRSLDNPVVQPNRPLQLAQNQPTNTHWPNFITSTEVYGLANWFRRKEHSKYDWSVIDPDKKVHAAWYQATGRRRILSFFNHLCPDSDLKHRTKDDEKVLRILRHPRFVKSKIADVKGSNPRSVELKQAHDNWMEKLGKQKYQSEVKKYYGWLKSTSVFNSMTVYLPKLIKSGGLLLGSRKEGEKVLQLLKEINPQFDIRQYIYEYLHFDDCWTCFLKHYEKWIAGSITIDELRSEAHHIFISGKISAPSLPVLPKSEKVLLLKHKPTKSAIRKATASSPGESKRTMFVSSRGDVTPTLPLITKEEAVQLGYASPDRGESNSESLIVQRIVRDKEALDRWHSLGVNNVEHFVLARGWKKIGEILLPVDKPTDDKGGEIATIELPPAIGRRCK